jgi:HPt (histidine-containing phosphotransfer) domain-containing protein
MAELSGEVRDASPSGSSAIDVEHLARMTLGDRAVEQEVLVLFDRQSALLLARLPNEPPEVVATLAHTLIGSARGIGAWQVAATAEALERAAREATDLSPALSCVAASVGDARRAIADLLNERTA